MYVHFGGIFYGNFVTIDNDSSTLQLKNYQSKSTFLLSLVPPNLQPVINVCKIDCIFWKNKLENSINF